MRRLATACCLSCHFGRSQLTSERFIHITPLALLASQSDKPGYSNDDALGAEDPFRAVGDAMKDQQRQLEKNEGGKGALPDDIDPTASALNRRRNRRKRTVDTILGDVLHDALRLRDMGHKPTADFVYKRTQERMYEEEYGHKPPSKSENAAKYVPFPPDFGLRRLVPLEMDDPWPQRAITQENPVWTRRQVEEDRAATGGAGLREWEAKTFGPREGFDSTGELTDAMDELAYWEECFLRFIREAPLPQRRTLPLLHEHYRYLTHRLIRAERHYIATRDVVLLKCHASPSVYKMSEDVVNRVRALYSETHRSLSSPNYDPVRMKKSVTGPLLQMSEAEFEEWKNVQKHRRNRFLSEIL
ncbi:uncharacterized protein TEOVI_000430300 [Trypanosoma equiperdum]|uniref:Uncharacterized protein n=1 Tax=Trypanosoma equiperdum TaxID=5694 RepID=A0A1G4IJK7_TRYEQ|nr:hypothetical protein, conserved [Trypanosoma equiperdum]